jgi:hypothetical protein
MAGPVVRCPSSPPPAGQARAPNCSRSWCFGFRGTIRPAAAGHVTLQPIQAGSSVPVIFSSYNREDKARRAKPNEALNFWLGFARGTCIAEALFRSFSQHFSDASNATARGPRA